MKTKAGKKESRKPRVLQAQYLAIAGKRMVLLEEEEYIRLRQKADDWEPLLPEPDANGFYPADETLGVILAQNHPPPPAPWPDASGVSPQGRDSP